MKTYGSLGLFVLAILFASTMPLTAENPAGVGVQVAADHVDFMVGTELVGRYNIGEKVAKPYLWPVKGPGGVSMTRAWPMEPKQEGGSDDHIHQKSAWFCHGDVIPEGMVLTEKIKGVDGVDFWAESKGHGRIVCKSVSASKSDKGHGQITTTNEWQTAGGNKVLDETRTIHLYDLGASRLFVVDSELVASVVPITFGDTKEGSFGIRINDAIREQKGGKGKLENAEGKVGERAVWGFVSPWCDYSGPIDGKVVGLTIFDHPSNPYPACWHSRSYGLMAANPFGRDKAGFPAMKGKTDLVKMEKGQKMKFRYGLLIHPGDAKDGKVADQYQQFLKLKD